VTGLGGRYWRLWAASTGSNLGDGVVLAALPLLAARLTRDPAAVAGVTVAAFLPWLLFGLFAGVIADRLDRRTIMWITDSGRAVVLMGLALTVAADVISLPIVYVAVLILGVGETLFDTASQSILPAMVDAGDLETANGRLFGAALAANGFVGPPLGGLLFAVAAAVPFGFDAVTFGASALLILGIGGRFRAHRDERTTVAADIKEGLSFLWRQRTIRAFAIGAATINLAYTAAAAVLVLYAQDILGLGDVGYGLLHAGAAIGGIVGTLAAAPIVRWIGRPVAVLSSVVALAIALGSMARMTSPWAAGAALAGFAFASEVWDIVAVSYRQAATPDALLGRLMAGYRVIAYGAFPVGAALGGVLARALGLRAPFVVGGLLILLLLVYLAPVFASSDLTAVESA
jgi:MFS family permease